MKRMFLPYGYAVGSLLAGTLLVSFLLAALFYFQIIAASVYEGLAWGCGLLMLAIAGYVFGNHLHSRILIQILLVTLVLLVVMLIIGATDVFAVLRIISKASAFFIGALIGQHLKK